MSKELAARIREQIYPAAVLNGDRPPTLDERTRLLHKCVSIRLPILSAALVVGKSPASPRDKNWRGRALEAYLGGHSTSRAGRDFEDGELKSTRVLRKDGQWKIEQTLRITTLIHSNGAHLKPFDETPLYDKISCFSCVLIDSLKSEINSGSFVGAFVFKIDHDAEFLSAIRDDYKFYMDYVKNTGSEHVSSRVKSPNGFLYCRQTGGKAGKKSATSLYITPRKFNELLAYYGVNH
jgi:DNA mismatch repair protein MutH